jgi:GNAT superfamily N-acetyltransferase
VERTARRSGNRATPAEANGRPHHGAPLASAPGAVRPAPKARLRRLAAAVWNRTFGRRRGADLFELDRPAGAVPPSRAAYPPGYVFRRAGREEAAACSRVTNVPEAEILRRHDAGDACFVVAHGSRPATVFWVHDGPCYVRGLGYLHDGRKGDKYIYGVVTDPAHRGKGLYKNAVEDLAARLFEEGATRLVRIVEDGNAPALVTITRLGHRRTRRIESVLAFGVRRTVVKPLEGGPEERTWRILAPRDRFVI